MKKVLNLTIDRDSTSYINSLYSVLVGSQLFQGPKYMLSGMTGMAFKFTVVEGISPVSVNSYGPWAKENWTAVNNLGIYNETKADRCRHRTFPLMQKNAIKDIKESIDKGLGVIYWIPHFGVIYGYDDEQKIFYYMEGEDYYHKGNQSLLEGKIVTYDNILLNQSLIWFYQTFDEKKVKKIKDIYKDSFILALFDWKKGNKSGKSASGLAAYDFMINEMKSENINAQGAAYVLDTYTTSKFEIFQYINEVKREIPELEKASGLYSTVYDIYSEIKRMIRFQNRYSKVLPTQFNSLVELLKELKFMRVKRWGR